MGDVDIITAPEYYEKAVKRLIKAGYIEEHSDTSGIDPSGTVRLNRTALRNQGYSERKDGKTTVSAAAEERVRALLSDLISTAREVSHTARFGDHPRRFPHG